MDGATLQIMFEIMLALFNINIGLTLWTIRKLSRLERSLAEMKVCTQMLMNRVFNVNLNVDPPEERH